MTMRPDDNNKNDSQNQRTTNGQIMEILSSMQHTNPPFNIMGENESLFSPGLDFFGGKTDKNFNASKYAVIVSMNESITYVQNDVWKNLKENPFTKAIQNFVESNPECNLTHQNTKKISIEDIKNLTQNMIFFWPKPSRPSLLPTHSRITITLLPDTVDKVKSILEILFESLKKYSEINFFKIMSTDLKDFFTRRDQFIMYVNTTDPKKLGEIISYISERLPADIPESPGPYFLKKEGHGIWSGPNNSKSIRYITAYAILATIKDMRKSKRRDAAFMVQLFINRIKRQFPEVSCKNGYLEYENSDIYDD